MLHVRTSQLIIAEDGCGIQGDFFPQCKKIFGLTNKSERMSTKNVPGYVCNHGSPRNETLHFGNVHVFPRSETRVISPTEWRNVTGKVT